MNLNFVLREKGKKSRKILTLNLISIFSDLFFNSSHKKNWKQNTSLIEKNRLYKFFNSIYLSKIIPNFYSPNGRR